MKFLTLIKGNKLIVPLAFVAAIAMLTISELSYWYTSRYTEESMVTRKIHDILSNLQIRMLNAETGQRDFLRTGRTEYLQPHNSATQAISKSIEELRQRYKNQPESMGLLNELDQLFGNRLMEMAKTVELYKTGLPQASWDLVLTGTGKDMVDRMQLITTRLLTSEEENLQRFQSNMRLTILLGRISIALLSMLCLISILIYLKRNLSLKTEQSGLRQLLAAERDQLGILVRKRTDELTRLTRYLQTNREDERSRLARNLHDDLGALLTSAKMDTARIKSRVDANSPELIELLAHLVGNLNNSIALGRRIIEDLRPSALSNLGLVETLDILAREFAQSSGLQVHKNFEDIDLPADSQLMVYRLMQEACTNILKYAKASHVWMTLRITEDVIIASVRDDGVGFNLSERLTSSFGLLGMRYRVEAANGELSVVSSLGNGTLVQASLARAHQ
jgi:signal transduction histidine kinase